MLLCSSQASLELAMQPRMTSDLILLLQPPEEYGHKLMLLCLAHDVLFLISLG